MISSSTAALIRPEKDITLEHWDKVNEICKPLAQFGINFFNYMKIYTDGSIVDLNNAPDIHNHFYYETNLHLDCILFKQSFSLAEGFVTLSSIYDKGFIELARDKFDIDHIVVFVEKQNEFTTYWEFGTHAGNDKIINFYLNNTDLLKSFIAHFRQTGNNLIHLCENNRYRILTLKSSIEDSRNSQGLCFYDNVAIKSEIRKFILGETSFNLTAKEIECLQLCSTGKTAEEISLSLVVSKRTVESHLKNAKDKLRCTNIAQAVSRAYLLKYL